MSRRKCVPVTASEILAELEGIPGLTVHDLIAATGGSPNQIGGLLGQLKQHGRVTRERAGGLTRWWPTGPTVRPQPPDPLEGLEGTDRMMRTNRAPRATRSPL